MKKIHMRTRKQISTHSNTVTHMYMSVIVYVFSWHIFLKMTYEDLNLGFLLAFSCSCMLWLKVGLGMRKYCPKSVLLWQFYMFIRYSVVIFQVSTYTYMSAWFHGSGFVCVSIYIYMCVCVCVCLCFYKYITQPARLRKMRHKLKLKRNLLSFKLSFLSQFSPVVMSN